MNDGKERMTPSERDRIDRGHQEYIEHQKQDQIEQQAREQVNTERAKKKRLDGIREYLAGCGIPKRFLDKTLDNYKTNTAPSREIHALKTTRRFAETIIGGESTNAIFMGTAGTGKNHLATGVAREIVLALKSVIATTTMKMIKHFRTTWTYGRHAEQSEEVIFETYTTPDLLILDEVGIQYGTESERIMIFDVLNERYGAELSTLLITNLNMEELGSYISERLLDRLKEDGCEVVVFNWPSHRGK